MVLFMAVCAVKLHAQNAVFLTQGRIEYEKRINVYAQFGEDNSWTEEIKKHIPQFQTYYFDLRFNNNKTLYTPGRENPDNNKGFMGEQPATDNIIFTNLDSSKSVSQKKIFEQTFLINDSTRRIRWKITDETRNIAGFDCRRANALIMDSIYVVAFYTDAIIPSGGPESFTGLPGMILGLAIPHEHVTWFATKVYTESVPDAVLKQPARGKKMTNAQLTETIQTLTKDWGKWARMYVLASLL